ncbi:MAG: ATP-binding cassette domain-containing protein [Treponema sp.]|nr:ATP-binding cassette domain-containing protein [Treponema sp.]
MSDFLLRAKGVKKHFPIREGILQRIVGYVRAVDGVDINVRRGSVLGIVGESGCGKSTIGRVLCNLIPKTEGTIEFDGQDIHTKDSQKAKEFRRRVNFVFQDPFSSLNPRLTVAQIIGEPLLAHKLVKNKKEMTIRAVYFLEKCGMFADQVYRYPHQFSGGQRQRICVARALAAESEFIVCDEAVSALDVSIQAQVINLLMDLRESYNLTYIFISHDLNVVRFISDYVSVMYLGQIVESAPKDELFDNPTHPYTKALLSAVPTFDKASRQGRIILEGDIPSPSNPPPGCRFHTRCKEVLPKCSMDSPPLYEVSPGHTVQCHRCTP